MFDRARLVKECTNMLRVITAKDFGINKEYAERLHDFEKTVFYDVKISYDDTGTVIWKSYDKSPKPIIGSARTVNVDVAFSPGLMFGNDDASLIAFGELMPFGEEGLYSDIFFKFEESFGEENAYEDEMYHEGLFIVHNSDELAYLMCSVVKEQWDWRASQDVKYTKSLELLYDYIDEVVCCDLSRWPKLFGDLQSNIPITFHRWESEEGHYIKGDFDPTNSDVVINIYQCNLADIENLKTTIRHELIHYGLFHAGLPFWDDSAVFWYFALKLNAAPYKELHSMERELLLALRSLEEHELEETLLKLREKIITEMNGV